MKKIVLCVLVGSMSILNVGCGDSKDWSSAVVDYEKAHNNLLQRQTYFIPNTSFQLRFNVLSPSAFIEEDRNGIRKAIVAHNSDTMTSGDFIVNCEEQLYVWRQYFSKGVLEIKNDKSGTQGFAIMANICLLPSTPSILDSKITWKP
jgi:hypothetical protein